MDRRNHIFIVTLIVSGARALVLCLALLAGTSSASASSAPKADSQKESGEPQPGDEGYVPPHSSNMPMMLVPAVVNGRMSHHIFVSYRLVMHNELQVDTVNQKIAWLHDAFLREVYKINPIDPENSDHVDKALLEKRFKEIANEMLHGEIVDAVYFIETRSENESLQAEYTAPRRGKKSEPAKSGH